MTITSPPVTAALAAAPEETEITIAQGDDSFCTTCLCDLPAGSPAWPDGDGGYWCADDAPEDITEEQR